MVKTAVEMIPAVGQTVSVRLESFWMPMRVQDVKQSYGQVRILVSPVNGTGTAWIQVQAGRVKAIVSGSTALTQDVVSADNKVA